jgi:hypothetical protein
MSRGPILIFDKSSLESLDLDEAVLLDNFFMTSITPLFFVECLADLEKALRSKSTPEQLVGSLATRTPDANSYPNTHHLTLLRAELAGKFKLNTAKRRIPLSHGQCVQLGDKNGFLFERSPEAEAFSRWRNREFLDLERIIAKQWRRALDGVDLAGMANQMLRDLGPWRRPKSLTDARSMTDTIIDNLDSEWLIRFGLALLGASEFADATVTAWTAKRRPPLREHLPYFVFMLAINIFFCLALPAQLLRKVKASHKIDLAYLYYLPFCAVFTSKDGFHADVAPLFIDPDQSFVNGADLKSDLRRIVTHYESLPKNVLESGLGGFAAFPPDDADCLIARLWDKHWPNWREKRDEPQVTLTPDAQSAILELVQKQTDAKKLEGSEEQVVADMDFATIRRSLAPKKGRWLRFSREQIQRVPSKDTAVVVTALSRHIRKLPARLRRSLTWDRGLEMAKHKDFTVATDVQVYFCDPQSPWQRGTNENTNLLLRQYFPRGTDLSGYSQAQLDQVALRLNQRPRKTLGFQTPASKLHASVASTI